MFPRYRSHDTATRVRNPSCNKCCNPTEGVNTGSSTCGNFRPETTSVCGKSKCRPTPRYGFFLDQLVEKLPAFSGTRKFVAMITKVHNLTLNLMVQWFPSCLVFGNSRVQILTRRPVVRNEPLRGFPQSNQANSGTEN